MREINFVQINHSHFAESVLRHGLVALSNTANVLHKTTEYYLSKDERCIRWVDQVLAIKWPIQQAPILSAKARQGDMCAVAALF